MKKFDPSIQRQMFWSNAVGGKTYCPRCLSRLENENQVFMMAIRESHDAKPFVVGNDAGYFCPQCPTIILDGDTFAEFARGSVDRDTDAEFSVLGLVDLEAVPEEKRSVPLGGDDNPIPFVKFTNLSEGKPQRHKTAAQRKKKKRLKRKERH